MTVKYDLKNPIWETDPQKAKAYLVKYLNRRRRQLEKWKPTGDRGQGIHDELLILVNALLGNDTNILCMASLVPPERRKIFDQMVLTNHTGDKK